MKLKDEALLKMVVFEKAGTPFKCRRAVILQKETNKQIMASVKAAKLKQA